MTGKLFNKVASDLVTEAHVFGLDDDGMWKPMHINNINEHLHVTQSSLGRYFVGTTPRLSVPTHVAVVVALRNPVASSRNIHVAVVTLYTSLNRVISFYFDATHQLAESMVQGVVVNRSVNNVPKGSITYAVGQNPNVSGTLGFYRVTVKEGATQEMDQDGKFILPPGSNHLLYVEPKSTAGEMIVGFGWWEEPVA